MPATTTMPANDVTRYRATARAREARRQFELAAHRERAWLVARAAAEVLRRSFGATRIVLFGSLAGDGAISLHSDVDLAVDGISPDGYFTAVGRLQGLDAGVGVDLVRFEDAPAALVAAIESAGVAL